LKAGDSFVSETVFSHESKLTLIAQAQAQGFLVMLLVVALDDPAQLLERVARRVNEGGHPVPTQRILERFPRTLTNLTKAVRFADAAMLYDSTESVVDTQRAVALCKGAWTQELVSPLPAWAQQVLGLSRST
jgi:predicted ABC-type ATPase